MDTKTYIGQWNTVSPKTLPEGEGREILVASKRGAVRQIHSHTLIGLVESGLVDGEECQYTDWSETPLAPLPSAKPKSFHDRSRFYESAIIDGGLSEYPAN